MLRLEAPRADWALAERPLDIPEYALFEGWELRAALLLRLAF